MYTVVGVVLGWVRRRGWRLIPQYVVGRQTAQIALWQLFAVTLAVSRVLAARGTFLAMTTSLTSLRTEIASIFVALAVASLLAVWIALPTGSCWPRLFLASLVVGSLVFFAYSVFVPRAVGCRSPCRNYLCSFTRLAASGTLVGLPACAPG